MATVVVFYKLGSIAYIFIVKAFFISMDFADTPLFVPLIHTAMP